MTKKLIVPAVHLNGTSKNELTAALSNAGKAMRDAINALRETAPHGRDYYVIRASPSNVEPLTPYSVARRQYYERLLMLENAYAELVAIFYAIHEGKTETEVKIIEYE